MILIDEQGLTDAPVPVAIYCKALGIEGYVIRPEERDLVIRALYLHPPAAGAVTVYTGPIAMRYWEGAPPPVRVVIVPGETEVPATSRTSGIEWHLRKLGIPTAEARALTEKPPTGKHRHFPTFLAAVREEEAWKLLPDSETLPEMGYVGDYQPQEGRELYTVTLVTRVREYKMLADRLTRAAQNDEVIGFDVETDEEENYETRVVGAGFAFGATGEALHNGTGVAETYYLPFNGPLGEELARGLLELHFRERVPPRFIAHNGKYDSQALAKDLEPGAPLRLLRKLTSRLAGDGLIAWYCLAKVDEASGRNLPKVLKYLTLEHFGVRTLHFQEMLDLSGSARSSEAPITDIGPYCCADAFWGVKVEERARAELARYPKLLAIYEKVELPTVAVTADMELLGIPLDYALLAKRRDEYAKRVEIYRRYLEKQAVRAGYALTVKKQMCKLHSKKKVDYEPCNRCDERGRVEVTLPFNPNSGPQVEAVLQGVFGLPRMASTDGGAASNDEASLLRLRDFTSNEDAKDWISMKLAWSKDYKVLGTYLGNPEKATDGDPGGGMWGRKRQHVEYNLPAGVSASESWYIHPTWNQAVTTSGRYSSKDPNGQNIPLGQRDLFTVKVVNEAMRHG